MKRVILGPAVLVSCMTLTAAADAQPKSLKDQLVGTWTLASIVNTDDKGAKSTPWTARPLGAYMFDEAGHFAEMIINPDKDNATVDYYGTYSVDEGGKTIVLHVIGSSASRFNGTDAKRTVVSISDDSMETHNAVASLGGSADSVWKRAK
jgi:hypothetical protein